MAPNGVGRPAPRPAGGRTPAVLVLAVLLLAGCRAGAEAARTGRTGGAAAAAAAAAAGGRRQLQSPARALLQQTCTCPATDAAETTCGQGAQSEKDTLLRAVVQYCTRLGFAPATCCPNMPINESKWQLWTACLW